MKSKRKVLLLSLAAVSAFVAYALLTLLGVQADSVHAIPDDFQADPGGGWDSGNAEVEIDEDIDFFDGNIIDSNPSPQTPDDIFELTLDDPVPVGDEVDTVEIRVRALKNNNNRTIDLFVILRDGADATVDSFTINLTTSMTNYTAGVLDVTNISKVDWANYDLRIEPTTGAGGGAPTVVRIDTVNIDLVTVLVRRVIIID
ncbi:hypothetical protein LCGC14_1437560 [marine sediment metagenome]|uniref:Uncharacterized protein n=1 Tax=marine sediment metagenome TaxID=412755 RepID=A0A0F9MNG8_9ZZZZ